MGVKDKVVCVMGAGYVGLPLALGFAKAGLKTYAIDRDSGKIGRLKPSANPLFTTDPSVISEADFVIICVPTPVTEDKKPDLSAVMSAGETAAMHLKPGAVVVLESTVYPGLTEEVLKPMLQKTGRPFRLGYSPERMNPGDQEHSLDKITKVVSGQDRETTDELAELYSLVSGSVYRAEDIKTAEAAKVIENIQRDLNIALVNELSMIFSRMGIDTASVLEAAETKWNFAPYRPGLVGGHCIPVDPYYLVHKSRELGFEPRVILAGRETNDSMPAYLASLAEHALSSAGKEMSGSRVLLMGLTFKKNVDDTRNAPAHALIKRLKAMGAEVCGIDPLLGSDKASASFGIECIEMPASGYDCVIMVTDHDEFREIGRETLRSLFRGKPVIVDSRGFFDPEELKDFIYVSM